jgi:hypothetical protein
LPGKVQIGFTPKNQEFASDFRGRGSFRKPFVSRILNDPEHSARIPVVTHSPFRFSIAFVAAALASAVAMPALAQDRGMAPEARPIMPQGARNDGGRSLSEAIRRVQRSTGGQILGAERVPFDGRNINRVKYLDDRGRVRYMDDTTPDASGPRVPRPSEMSDGPLPPRGDHR